MIRTTAVLASTVFFLGLPSSSRAQEDLALSFQRPPDVAKPHTWWHWMNGNITRAGITADLEAMKQIGLGGAQIFNVSEAIPDGPVPFMSPEWRELVLFAAEEADRVGLELCIHNCAGWSSSGGPWITPEHAMQMVVMSETRVTGPQSFAKALPQPETRHDYYRDIAVLAFPAPQDEGRRIEDYRGKAGYAPPGEARPTYEVFPAAAVIRRTDIVELSDKLAGDGRLSWDVPAGDWIVLRIGYTPTGAMNAPAPASGRGLECDKLSRAGLDAHWAGMMEPLLEDLGPLAGRVLNNCLIDSYEMGGQNWTADFRAEFQKRRGYDPLLLLPTMSGRVVDSGEISDRFLWDLRRTIADLFADNYYSHFRELCRKHGLRASIEPYGGPFDNVQVGGMADIPMGEFWVNGGAAETCQLAASVGHTYGQPIIGAESFTAGPSEGRWQNHPYALKAIGDQIYCAGINRFIIHRYAHQPWLDRFPGMTMGQWGTHFDRTVTWWQQGTAWVHYLTRCQYLLQQGRFVADVCYFLGEEPPGGSPPNPALKAQGYSVDACDTEVLLNRMAVEDGWLALPSGMRYRLLVLPDVPSMTPRTLAKVRELVQAGATVLGPKPLKSPSLSGYPECDATVRQMAEEAWGECDGQTVKTRAFGRGRVFWGLSVEETLAQMNVTPDCTFAAADAKPKMSWIHRVSGTSEIYFLSNQKPRPMDVECSFRVSGKMPELWHPDTGLVEAAAIWSERDGHTTLPIRFDPAGSVFVVFRSAAGTTPHLVAVKPPPAEVPVLAEPKIEIRGARYEAEDGAGGADVTAKVAELVAAGETSIPANNATFGDPIYMHVKRLRVECTLDGQPLTRVARENEMLVLVDVSYPASLPRYSVTCARGHATPELRAFEPGVYEFAKGAGRTTQVSVNFVPAPLEITGPWTVNFPANWGAPARITLDKLISWTEYSDAGVRYFSGTAEYQKEFEIPAALLEQGQALYLDLGQVKELAEVTLNGHDLGVWWKPPFAAEVTNFVQPGRNTLKIRVTNLWANRLIGDEQYPDDCEWDGVHLKRWPTWLREGQSRPVSERLTFTTWRHYTRDSTLQESGLLGPVVLRAAARLNIE